MGNGRIFKINTPLDIEQGMIPLNSYFIATGFIDMLPTALIMARELNYGFNEVAEAICKVGDKSKQYPPIKNRTAWFKKVFREKLAEARADILAYREEKRYR